MGTVRNLVSRVATQVITQVWDHYSQLVGPKLRQNSQATTLHGDRHNQEATQDRGVKGRLLESDWLRVSIKKKNLST